MTSPTSQAISTIPGLHDIHELDHISFWPLPVSAWVVIFLLLMIAAALTVWIWRRAHRLPTWQKKILVKLNELNSLLIPENSRATALEISQIIRRLAIHRHGRETCAGLEGDAWLNWLTTHDHKHFQWNKESNFLVTAPYAPMDSQIDLEPIRKTIFALKGWVK